MRELTRQAVTYPLVTLSTRAQVDSKGEHPNITAALKKIIDKEGVAGLYAGLKSALFGIGLTNGKDAVPQTIALTRRNLLLLVRME